MKKLFTTLALGLAAVLVTITAHSTTTSVNHTDKERQAALTAMLDSIGATLPMECPVSFEIPSVTGNDIVEKAIQYLGVRYRRGGKTPTAFDCSGFTSYVYKTEDIDLNCSSRTQYTQGQKIACTTELQKGDLVFFGGSRSRSSVGHVGIVTDVDSLSGEFSFIHASNSGVRISSSTEPYYQKRYVGARRILSQD